MKRTSINEASNIQLRGIAYEDRRVKLFNGVACFFTRIGGNSLSLMDSLNCSNSIYEGDKDIARNLRIASAFLSIDPSRVVMCDQRHSDVIVSLSAPPLSMPVADAIIAERPGVFPAIRTADCLPILLIDPVSRLSAAIHAGWRGTVKRLTLKVLETMTSEYGVKAENVFAVLGPRIGACCYEVGEEVVDKIIRNIPNGEMYILSKESGKAGLNRSSYFIDLGAINRSEMLNCGVRDSNIESVDVFTSCRGDLFFSYRRDGGNTGRQISIVGLKS